MAHGAPNLDDSSGDPEESSEVSENRTCSALSDPPRTILAEIFVPHDGLLLVPTIESVSAVTVQMEETPMVDSSLVFVFFVGDDVAAFEHVIETDLTVREATLFSASTDQRVYRIDRHRPRSRFLAVAELGVRPLDVTSGDGSWVVRAQLLSREPLIELRKRCVESDITFKVLQLYGGSPNAEIADTRLTSHQRKTVLIAYQSGYYDIPRCISQGELAEKLDVSTSAISQQLRRATGQLIASMFAVDRD